MKSRLLAIISALLELCVARFASARPHCPALSVETDSLFRTRWPTLVDKVRQDFDARHDIDTCAKIAFGVEGDGIGISVALPDGRFASRRVSKSEDVVPTLEGLLLLPAAASAELAASPPPPAQSVRPPPRPAAHRAPAAPDDAATSGWSVAPRARPLGFELSLVASARVGDGQLGAGAGLLSLLQVHDWLVGFEGRVDRYSTLTSTDAEPVLTLALLAGKRMRFDSVTLDFTGGPAIAMKGMSSSQTVQVENRQMPEMRPDSSALPSAPDESSTGPLPRLLLGAHVGFQPDSTLRTFVGIDGELGPRQSGSATKASARLPAFAVGLAVGATLGKP